MPLGRQLWGTQGDDASGRNLRRFESRGVSSHAHIQRTRTKGVVGGVSVCVCVSGKSRQEHCICVRVCDGVSLFEHFDLVWVAEHPFWN